MIFTSHRGIKPSNKLCDFLNREFGLNNNAINLGIKHSQLEAAPIAIILWSLGMLDIKEYQLLLDWIDKNE